MYRQNWKEFGKWYSGGNIDGQPHYQKKQSKN
jgi:hypothetical protein